MDTLRKHIEKVNTSHNVVLDEKGNYNHSYYDLNVEQVELDGVIYEDYKYVKVEPAKKFEEFKVSDFSLQNIIQTGNLAMLKESKLSINNSAYDNEKIEELTEKLEKYVTKSTEN